MAANALSGLPAVCGPVARARRFAPPPGEACCVLQNFPGGDAAHLAGLRVPGGKTPSTLRRINMFLAVTTLPRRGRQAGMLTENLAKIADVVKSAFHRPLGERQGIADKQLFRRPHPLTVQRFG